MLLEIPNRDINIPHVTRHPETRPIANLGLGAARKDFSGWFLGGGGHSHLNTVLAYIATALCLLVKMAIFQLQPLLASAQT